MYQYAITRLPPKSMALGITTQNEKVDIELAYQQHSKYVEALKSVGVKVTVLDADEDHPDSHFVEDTAIIHQSIAVLTNPGAEVRRKEVAHIRPHLERVLEVRELSEDDNAFVDGGDVLFMGNHLFIGLSYRTNLLGAESLKQRMLEINPDLSIHFISFEGVLHLKTGMTSLGPDLLIGDPTMKLQNPLPAGRVVWLPPEQGYAANTLVVNGAALYFHEYDAAKSAAQDAGLKPIPLDISEFRKMDGSFTCLSLLW